MRRIPLLTTFIASAFALTASIANAEDAPAAQDIANKASAASYYQGKDGKQYVVTVNTGGGNTGAPLTSDEVTAFTLK